MVFVTLNISFPRGHRFFVHHPNLFGHLIDETEIVGYQNQPTTKIIDGISQAINTFYVQVIGLHAWTIIQ